MSLFRLRFQSAGESHGASLVAVLEGLPAGLAVDPAFVDRELARRQGGHGRSGRMKIEKDRAEFLSGLRAGRTLGSPVAIRIENLDHGAWRGVVSPFESNDEASERRRVSAPRPGHADLAGGLKWETKDLRDVLERASARETASRVAAGALAKLLLLQAGVEIRSGVLGIGAVGSSPGDPVAIDFDSLPGPDDDSPFRLVDRTLEPAAMAAVDEAARNGDTLGGSLVVAARALPPGLGSAFAWDRRLDGRLGQALLSIPAVKAVAFGDALAACRRPGSSVHDAIEWTAGRGFSRPTNRAGGLEGGMTNGEPIVALVAMKPIATLRRGLPSVDVDTKEPRRSDFERSDVTAVPACGVVAEAMTALVLADALLEKTGGDTMEEVLRNLDEFRDRVRRD